MLQKSVQVAERELTKSIREKEDKQRLMRHGKLSKRRERFRLSLGGFVKLAEKVKECTTDQKNWVFFKLYLNGPNSLGTNRLLIAMKTALNRCYCILVQSNRFRTIPP